MDSESILLIIITGLIAIVAVLLVTMYFQKKIVNLELEAKINEVKIENQRSPKKPMKKIVRKVAGANYSSNSNFFEYTKDEIPPENPGQIGAAASQPAIKTLKVTANEQTEDFLQRNQVNNQSISLKETQVTINPHVEVAKKIIIDDQLVIDKKKDIEIPKQEVEVPKKPEIEVKPKPNKIKKEEPVKGTPEVPEIKEKQPEIIITPPKQEEKENPPQKETPKFSQAPKEVSQLPEVLPTEIQIPEPKKKEPASLAKDQKNEEAKKPVPVPAASEVETKTDNTIPSFQQPRPDPIPSFQRPRSDPIPTFQQPRPDPIPTFQQPRPDPIPPHNHPKPEPKKEEIQIPESVQIEAEIKQVTVENTPETQEAEAKKQPEADPVPKEEKKPEPKVEQKPEIKEEKKPEIKIEKKSEIKVEKKPDLPKIEPKQEPKEEKQSEIKEEKKSENKIEKKPEMKLELPKTEPKEEKQPEIKEEKPINIILHSDNMNHRSSSPISIKKTENKKSLTIQKHSSDEKFETVTLIPKEKAAEPANERPPSPLEVEQLAPVQERDIKIDLEEKPTNKTETPQKTDAKPSRSMVQESTPKKESTPFEETPKKEQPIKAAQPTTPKANAVTITTPVQKNCNFEQVYLPEVVSTPRPTPAPTQPQTPVKRSEVTLSELVQVINEIRVQNNRAPLNWSPYLADLAIEHSAFCSKHQVNTAPLKKVSAKHPEFNETNLGGFSLSKSNGFPLSQMLKEIQETPKLCAQFLNENWNGIGFGAHENDLTHMIYGCFLFGQIAENLYGSIPDSNQILNYSTNLNNGNGNSNSNNNLLKGSKTPKSTQNPMAISEKQPPKSEKPKRNKVSKQNDKNLRDMSIDQLEEELGTQVVHKLNKKRQEKQLPDLEVFTELQAEISNHLKQFTGTLDSYLLEVRAKFNPKLGHFWCRGCETIREDVVRNLTSQFISHAESYTHLMSSNNRVVFVLSQKPEDPETIRAITIIGEIGESVSVPTEEECKKKVEDDGSRKNRVLELINSIRNQNQLPDLIMNQKLMDASQLYAQKMATKQVPCLKLPQEIATDLQANGVEIQFACGTSTNLKSLENAVKSLEQKLLSPECKDLDQIGIGLTDLRQIQMLYVAIITAKFN